MERLRARLVALSAAAAILGGSAEARGAGLYFSDRGVRPLARGGAFVAGADDMGAMWYNPAGLADAGSSILADFAWMHFTSDYTRQTQVTDSNGTLRQYDFPTVQGTTPVLPIPTIGGSLALGPHKEWTLGLGVLAPYTAITSYPLTVNGQPAPQRYSLVSLDGSALVQGGAFLAFKPIEQIRIGVGFEALVGTFKATTVFSASPPDRLVAPPEDPTYDAFAQLKAGPIFAPSASAGITAVPEKHIRIGLAGQLPYSVNAPATVDVRLPTAVEFDKAYQSGNQAHIQFELPAIARAGVEFRTDLPNDMALRAEVAYTREFWTTHHSIDVHPDNVLLYGVRGFPSPYGVSTISIPRNFENANSYHLGSELSFTIAGYLLDARLGVSYEQSAVPVSYLSAMTIDLNKITPAIGGGLHIGEHWRLDAVYAHVFASDATVTPSEAAIPRVNPVKGNPTPTEAINGGVYSARADVVGVGLNYKF